MRGKIIGILRYFWYVLKHKYFVFLECLKMGMPIRGLLHDLSKFLPSEFFPYAAHFYPNGKKAQVRDKTGYYKPEDTGDPHFDFAWFLHQKRNSHHWQWYALPTSEGRLKCLPMSKKDRKEMLADWRGAGRAQNKPDTKAWWEKNKEKTFLHPETKSWIVNQLGLGLLKWDFCPKCGYSVHFEIDIWRCLHCDWQLHT